MINSSNSKYTKEDIERLRERYQKRKSQRVTLFALTIAVLIVVGVVIMPVMDILGITRRLWAPIVYVLIFGLILASAFVWKCPACKSQLGDIFRTKYCPKCGLKFYDDI